MNTKQKICLWVGIVVIVFMGLYPPWISRAAIGSRHSDVGCEWIWAAPELKSENSTYAAHLNIPRLCVQWFVAVVVTGGLIVSFKDKKEKKPNDEEGEKL